MPNLVEEVPIAITINDIHYAVMLSSPHDLDDFAFGYLLSEGVITQCNQVHDVTQNRLNQGINLNVIIANRRQYLLQQQQRTIKGTSGCGLCGKQAMELAFPELQRLPDASHLSMHQIHSLRPALSHWQMRARKSGALHAAFWIDTAGEICGCREDIGRHNAVDKIIGYALREGWDATGATLIVTSRCSVEIVQKAIVAGISTLCSLASPTQMAVEYAHRYNLNLVHIPKTDGPYQLSVGVRR